jgi:hypothetical protein
MHRENFNGALAAAVDEVPFPGVEDPHAVSAGAAASARTAISRHRVL